MEGRMWVDGHAPFTRWVDSEFEGLDRPTILVVEDDDDVRELLVTLLQVAGFAPQPCRTAEEGLDQLREHHFDLVLTDYMLPHRTGGWLLQEASREGLLETTPALLVTAHPNPVGAEGHEVILKPFDLDYLVDRVRQRLAAGSGKSAKSRTTTPASTSKAGDNGHAGCPEPIELILYVTAHSPRSETAIANIRNALRRFESTRVRLTICDLSENPTFGSVGAATPLVRRAPGPRTFILGHTTNPDLVLELLEGCGDQS